jgi:hypothetical protein
VRERVCARDNPKGKALPTARARERINRLGSKRSARGRQDMEATHGGPSSDVTQREPLGRRRIDGWALAADDCEQAPPLGRARFDGGHCRREGEMS